MAEARPAETNTEARRGADLAVVTCIKNEGEDLVEWLCFHRLIGVSRFIVYDNQSTDATRRILDEVPFKDEIVVRSVASESPQKEAFADALRRFRDELGWVAFIDGDEFIVPPPGAALVELLAEHEANGVNGIGINWRVFGSSGHLARPDGLVTESFTHRAPDKFKANRHVKSIVRIGKVREMVTQHYFRVEGAYLLCDGSKLPRRFDGVSDSVARRHSLTIHHYITKSREQCMRKIARGRPKPSWSDKKYRPMSYWENNDRNDKADRRAAKIIKPIRKEVLKLRDAIGRD
jgi:glycosyltransferase involved in cell wall biosynthesis